MRTWSKTAALLFVASSSAYYQTSVAAQTQPAFTPAAPETEVQVLDEATDPFAAEAIPVVQTGNQPGPGDVVLTDAGTVEIHVNDANLVEVLRMLSLQSQKNIIASKDVRGTVTANLYDVTVREALDAILHSNGFAYREQGNFVYVYSVRELEEMERANRTLATEVFRLHYTPASTAITMIMPVLSSDARTSYSAPAASGISVGGDVGGNSHATEDVIVVTDYPEHLDAVRQVIREIDRRPQQILIEATILRAALHEDNALGVDFTVLGGVNFGELTGAGTSAGALLSGQILNDPAAAGIVAGDAGGAGTAFTTGVPPGGLRVGVTSSNVAVFLSALEQVTDTVVLANPKVLALNKQKGQVIVGRRDGYLTTTVTDTAAVQTVEFLDTGTRLIFRPFIGDDGFIRMEIHPEDSMGGLSDANLPFKITTEVTTNVMVRDGHTIVIGGLFREESVTARGQIPYLGNIPVAGALFRRQRDRTVREEVIILLTPHIIKDDAAFAQASEAELRDADRLRVGVRRGMMWFGRERLAETSYDKAVAEMNRPRPNQRRALWHLNGAINLNPKFREAIDLKQSITGREVTSVDNSSIRYFVREQVLRDRMMPPVEPEPEVGAPLRITPSAPAHDQHPPAPAKQPPSVLQTELCDPISPEGEDFHVTDAAETPAFDDQATTDKPSIFSFEGIWSALTGNNDAADADPATPEQPDKKRDVTVVELHDEELEWGRSDERSDEEPMIVEIDPDWYLPTNDRK